MDISKRVVEYNIPIRESIRRRVIIFQTLLYYIDTRYYACLALRWSLHMHIYIYIYSFTYSHLCICPSGVLGIMLPVYPSKSMHDIYDDGNNNNNFY